MDEGRLEYLFELYVNGAASSEEEQEFLQLAEMPENRERLQVLLDSFIKAAQPDSTPSEIAEESILQAIFQAKPRVVPVHRMRPWRWVAAAVVVLMIVGGWWLVTSRKSQVTGDKTQVAQTHDVPAPKSTRAMITLADGTKVYLDSVGSGRIAQQSGVDVVRNEDGSINYELNRTSTSLSTGSGAKTQGEMQYNTAYNPRGSRVLPLTLNDGTKVWLNAESSLKYPAAFTGNTREVEITGEAYFEVAHDVNKPFHVKKGSTDVTVLGTHFNANAYEDEESLKVTLLEGSVKVNAANKTVTIKPGEQAQVNGGNAIGIVVNRDVDVDEVMAWKNGVFRFNNTNVKQIMREVARWYDVDVEYQGNFSDLNFGGFVSRQANVSELLKRLSATEQVHFKVEGRKVTVMK